MNTVGPSQGAAIVAANPSVSTTDAGISVRSVATVSSPHGVDPLMEFVKGQMLFSDEITL